MSVLEWLGITELVFLAAAGIFFIAGRLIGKNDPHNPITVFYETFWKVMLRRQIKLKHAVQSMDEHKVRQYEQFKQSGNMEGLRAMLETEFENRDVTEEELNAFLESIRPAPEEATPEQLQTGPAASERMCLINIQIVPFMQTNEVISMRSEGITIQSTAGPGDGSTNKNVIELIAESFGIKPYQVNLIKGHNRAQKVVQIAGLDQADVDMRLANR